MDVQKRIRSNHNFTYIQTSQLEADSDGASTSSASGFSEGMVDATLAIYSYLSLLTLAINFAVALAIVEKYSLNGAEVFSPQALFLGLGIVISRYLAPQSSRFVCIKAIRRH